jgi:hypothetical protein
MNAKGCGWGEREDVHPYEYDPTNYFWDGTNFSSPFGATDTPIDLNDQTQVVVQEAPPGEGYLWESGATTKFSDKLPVLLAGQILSIEPLSISNQIGPGEPPVANLDHSIQIMTTAPDNGSNEHLLTKRDNNGQWTFAKIQLPEGTTITDWNTINSSGVIAALGATDSVSTTTHALLLLPVEFVEVTPKLKDEAGND